MTRDLRQNTATRITVGPFLDKTDGITPETGLTATNEKITFVVDDNGVPTLVIDATATASGGDNDLVHVTNDDAGFYDLELTAAQVNYVGRAILSINYVTDHLPVFHEFNILTQAEWDAKYGTGARKADLVSILGTALTETAGYIAAAFKKLFNVETPVLTCESVNQTGDAYSSLTANRNEPGQGAPAASTSMLAKLDYLYKAWRNKKTQTASQYTLYADDGSTKDQKATVSTDGTTLTSGEMGTGA